MADSKPLEYRMIDAKVSKRCGSILISKRLDDGNATFLFSCPQALTGRLRETSVARGIRRASGPILHPNCAPTKRYQINPYTVFRGDGVDGAHHALERPVSTSLR
jgi:hypothetical protein